MNNPAWNRRSKTHIEPGETVLYKCNNGEIVITDARVVIGMENWPVKAITAIEVVPLKVITPRQWVMSEGMLNGVSLAALFGLAAIVLVAYMSMTGAYSLILELLVALLFIVAIGTAAYTVFHNPIEIYKLQLTLTGMHGGKHTYEVMYTWRYKPPAVEAALAIQKAIASTESRGLG